MRWSSGLDVGTQRPKRFDHTCYISRVIQVLMYVFELYVYVCMYLLQAISSPPSIGAQSDFFRCTNLGQERWFGPSLVAFDSVVGPLRALPRISASESGVESRRILRSFAPGASSPCVGAWGWMEESSALKGLTIRVILVELFRF